jgi:hypothetical protein
MSKNTTVYEAHCPFCGAIHTVTVDIDDFYKYEILGETAQRAFPNLSATEREQIISGICPDCQKKFFDEDAEE